MPDEEPNFSPEVLTALGLDQKRAGELSKHLGSGMATEIAAVVDHCTHSH